MALRLSLWVVRVSDLFCSVLQPFSIRGLATPWTYFLHLSLSSGMLTDSSTSRGPCQNLAVCLGFDGLILLNTSCHVASLRAGLTLIIYWVGLACVHLKLNSAIVADATPSCYLCGVARVQPSTSDGPTCNIP